MADELHISQTVADLGISLYVLGFGIGSESQPSESAH